MNRTMTVPTVQVTDLRRRYGGPDGHEAVAGVSFEAYPGEVFGVLGTNGAGKTSTLEVILGLAPATAGSVQVLGKDPVRDRRELRPYTAAMLQSAGFPSALTARETAQIWAGTIADPLPVDDVLGRVALAHRAQVPVSVLSGGERRRLDLALALLNRPRVLLLDEPTTGLDPESRRNTWDLIDEVRAEGTTVLLTTHYLDEVEHLADRLVLMDSGRVVREGTVAQIVAEHPAQISFADLGEPAPELPGAVESGSERGVTTVRTFDLQLTLTALLVWAQERGIGLADLRATSASLESVFLSVAHDQEGVDV